MAKLGLRDRESYDGLAEDDVDPNEVLGMTIALSDGRWITFIRVPDPTVIDADWLDRDLNVPERRRLVDRLGLSWLTLDANLWKPRRRRIACLRRTRPGMTACVLTAKDQICNCPPFLDHADMVSESFHPQMLMPLGR